MSRGPKKKDRPGKTAGPPPGQPVSPRGNTPGAAGLNDRRLTVAVCLFLALLVWAVFGQTLHFEFVNYDDGDQVFEHPVVKNGLSWQGIVWVFTHSNSGHWDPLNKLSHMLDCQFYGLNAGGHHLTNVLLHTASVILLFLALKRMTAAVWPSSFVAALFAIHPLHVESVAWVSERKDVLSGFFFMLTLWAYVRHARKPSLSGPANGVRPRVSSDYWLALLFFACGLLSKIMVATLPLLLLLLDYWPLGRFSRPKPADATDGKPPWSVSKRLMLEKIPFLGLILAAGVGLLFSRDRNNVVVAVALHTGQGVVPHRDFSLMSRIGHALLTPLVYLKQLFLPAGLAAYYPPDPVVPRWEIFLAAAVLAAITALALARWRKQPCLGVGWFWYLAMLAPVLALIGRGGEVRCDRYTYLPQIGLFILLAWAAVDWCARWRQRRMALGGLAALMVAALVFCARTQTAYWRNSESLWNHALACTSDNAVAHYNLGVVLAQKGDVEEALVQYQKALQIKPDYAEAHYNIANNLLRRGEVDEAIAHYQKAVQIKPDYAEAHSNLGSALFQKGSLDEAIAHYQKAVQIKPGYAEAQNNLASALLQKGNVDEAIVHYQKALQTKPDYAKAHVNLANALLRKGEADEAVVHYQKALQIKPDYWEAQNSLAWVLATAAKAARRNGPLAVQLAQQANQLAGGADPMILRTLAAAFAEAGQFPEAVETARRALQLAGAQSDRALADEIQSQLKLYQAGLPFRSP